MRVRVRVRVSIAAHKVRDLDIDSCPAQRSKGLQRVPG